MGVVLQTAATSIFVEVTMLYQVSKAQNIMVSIQSLKMLILRLKVQRRLPSLAEMVVERQPFCAVCVGKNNLIRYYLTTK